MKVKIKYYSEVTDTTVSFKVDQKWSNLILEIEREQYNVNHKESRRHEGLSLFDKDSKNSDLKANVCGQVLKKFSKDKLYATISKLKPKEQDLVQKIYLDDPQISQEEYAKELGIPAATLRKRTERVRDKLENLLK